MKQSPQEKHFLNLAGEYGVCSELAKRGITANLTFGNYKSADVIFFDINTKIVSTIEVKTTSSNRVVTGFFQKYTTPDTLHPDYWVIVQIQENLKSKYYVLSHNEMSRIQMERNNMKEWERINGVDNILIQSIEEFEDDWKKITVQEK